MSPSKASKPNKDYHYHEEVAQEMLNDGNIEGCIIYCIPTIRSFLAKHKWSFVTPTQYDDTFQELMITLWECCKSYNPEKKVKLLTWLYIHYRFCCLRIGRTELPIAFTFVQMNDEESYNITMEAEVTTEENINDLEEDLVIAKAQRRKRT